MNLTMCENCMTCWFARPEQRDCPHCARPAGGDMRVLPGFIVDGLDEKGIVQNLSRCGRLHKVLEAACELYGFALVMSENVAFALEAQPTPETQLGMHIARCITKAKLGQSQKWWCYNVTFRLYNDKADVAIEGLVRHDQ